jgi:hypothetical protein
MPARNSTSRIELRRTLEKESGDALGAKPATNPAMTTTETVNRPTVNPEIIETHEKFGRSALRFQRSIENPPSEPQRIGSRSP